MTLKAFVQRICALGLGVLVGLLASEGLVRAAGRSARVHGDKLRFDRDYGTLLRDSWLHGFETDSALLEVRGQRFKRARPAETERVVFIGDSGTAGTFVPLDASFPLQFAHRLRAAQPQRKVEVLNLAELGMTTVGELELLETKLLALEPDAVVLGLFMANDINFNLGHAALRQASAWRHELGVELRSVSALAQLAYEAALEVSRRNGLWRADPLRESWVPLEMRMVDENGYHILNFPVGEAATYVTPPSAMIEQAFELLGELLQRLRDLSVEHGFRASVVVLPAPSSVAGELTFLWAPDAFAELRRHGVTVARAQLGFDQPARRVRELCAALELTLIDPTDQLAARGLEVFFPANEHLTREGHALVADVLFAARRAVLGD